MRECGAQGENGVSTEEGAVLSAPPALTYLPRLYFSWTPQTPVFQQIANLNYVFAFCDPPAPARCVQKKQTLQGKVGQPGTGVSTTSNPTTHPAAHPRPIIDILSCPDCPARVAIQREQSIKGTLQRLPPSGLNLGGERGPRSHRARENHWIERSSRGRGRRGGGTHLERAQAGRSAQRRTEQKSPSEVSSTNSPPIRQRKGLGFCLLLTR